MVETIKYDLPIRNLIEDVNAAGHVTHKKCKKTSVTLHGNGANLTLEGAVSTWRSRGVSAQFDIDISGNIAQGVVVDEYSWSVGPHVGNETSIHIDLANRTGSPRFEFTEVTLRAAARLIGWLFVHVIDDHPSRDNVLMHDYWSRVNCPGPFLVSIFDEFLGEIQGWYENYRAEQRVPVTFDQRTETTEVVEQINGIQKLLGIDVTGEWDVETDQAMLEFRRKHLRR